LWTRDPNVSFKIGSRPYALTDKLKVSGLGLQELEKERHYHYIDLTEKLSRREDITSWLFPKLADDVVKRRLKEMGYPEKKIIDVFGKTISPYIKANKIINKDSRKRALGSPSLLKEIPELKLNFLIDLAMGNEPVSRYGHLKDENDIGDLLSAKLGIAWILQNKEFELPSQTENNYTLPWNTDKARWWKKERINQALLQISSSSGQRTIWCGKEDILTLASSNILIFLNICREIWRIWDQALRVKDKLNIDFNNEPIINTKFQSAGIYATSSLWYNKVITRTKGDSRKKLLDKIAKLLSTKLKGDYKMSNPGHNGFSLAVSEYDDHSEVKDTLMKAVRYGDLVELHHTPKNKNQERRRKWYLLPILSPELSLPASHTKEPLYMNVIKIKEWISEAQTPNEDELKK
jgi:rRNA processing protein Gar1